MEPAGGALPTWSFRLETVPAGRHQVHLHPFQKIWTVEVPAGGREDLELAIPELAEVLVETVDARTGERVPLELPAHEDNREYLRTKKVKMGHLLKSV